SGGADRLAKLWDLTARKEVFSRTHSWPVLDVAFRPGQDLVLSCASGGTGVVRTEIRLGDAAGGQRAPVSRGFPLHATAVAFTAEPGQIACADRDGGIHFFDVDTGRTTCTLRGHAGEVKSLAATRDGARLVTSSADRTVRVWPARNPKFGLVPLH